MDGWTCKHAGIAAACSLCSTSSLGFSCKKHPFHASISIRGKSWVPLSQWGAKLSSVPRANQFYLNEHVCNCKILGRKKVKQNKLQFVHLVDNLRGNMSETTEH